jgi:hypothetical protein
MPPGRPARADETSDAPAMLGPVLRVLLGGWAAAIYLMYWLGYLGLR